jgi:hypothetical protein
MQGILDKMDIDFNDFIEERKEFAADFVIKSITNQAFRPARQNESNGTSKTK